MPLLPRPGDALVTPSLDHYGRSLQRLINMVAEPSKRGVCFTSLHENLDSTTPGSRLFHVFAALAELIRKLIVISTAAGLAAAHARGRVGGRPTMATKEVMRTAQGLSPKEQSERCGERSPGPIWSNAQDLWIGSGRDAEGVPSRMILDGHRVGPRCSAGRVGTPCLA
ncbi:recombinase family protein [Streptomyces sp. NPDC002785]|uniref:recombinase family protein n=1 Tax=Streptomyces sp. NPDC002785 TaxID=3154543 RepID=UPI00331F4BA0